MFWVFCACTGLSVADCVLLFCAFAVSAVGFVVLVGFVVFVGFVVLFVLFFLILFFSFYLASS